MSICSPNFLHRDLAVAAPTEGGNAARELGVVLAREDRVDDERLEAQFELNRQPRDAARVRVRNRDAADGRPRGYLRKFGLSRVRVRNMAHRGELPGVRKSSW